MHLTRARAQVNSRLGLVFFFSAWGFARLDLAQSFMERGINRQGLGFRV